MRSRPLIAACIALLVVLLSPVWVFELLYVYGLALCDKLPSARPDADVPAIAEQALWAVTSELADTTVGRLWAANYFAMPVGRIPDDFDYHGRIAARRVATLWTWDREDPLMGLKRVVVVGAVAVWLTRHATASELKHLLA